VRLRDIGRVELDKRGLLGGEPHERQDIDHHLHLPAAGANAVATAKAVRARMDELKKSFPPASTTASRSTRASSR
jgi:multidrug efflux pump subunit AcrB